MPEGVICQSCGVEAPTRYVEMYQNVGLLIVRFHKAVKGNLCKRCVHKFFWQFTLTNLTVGWLGTISLIVAPCFAINNIIRYLTVLGMPAVPRGATPPVLTDDAIAKLHPHVDALFARLNAGEPVVAIARDLAQRSGVTPGQVVLYASAVIRAAQGQTPPPNPPTYGFPVQPVPVPALPVESETV